MRRFLASWLLVTLSVVALPAQAQIPAEVLKDIKAATVFVKVRTDQGASSGSGFLMQVDGDSAFIVTNEHVVGGKKSSGNKPSLPAPKVEVVFDSGRKTERVFPATVLAADAERDLAILQIKNAKDLPKPLDLAEKVDAIETMTIYIVGFPFGAMLSTTKGNPALTIGKGTVSSIREDERGEAKYVQIDGDINPGNSGGPVVDTKGRLVGVAVAKLVGTNIGLAIPPSELTNMLNGRIHRVMVRTGKADNTSAELAIEFELIDPLHKIRNASARVVPVDKLRGATSKDKGGRFLPLPEAQVLDLKIENQKCVGSLTVRADGQTERDYRIQPAYIGVDDILIHSAPTSPHRVVFASAPNVVKSNWKPEPQIFLSPQVPVPGLGRTHQPIGEVKVTDLHATFSSGPPCMCWSADATAFYHLDSEGTVRRISIPSGNETAILKTGRRCNWLCRSAMGLALTVGGAQEVWLLDPQTLKVMSRIPIGNASQVVSAPTSEMAFAAGSDASTLCVIDLRTEKIAKQYTVQEFRRSYLELRQPVMTPDGRYIVTHGTGRLHRFRVNGEELVFDETSPSIIEGGFQAICISNDGDYICAPSGGGNTNARRKDNDGYATYVFSIGLFAATDLILGQGAHPQAVGFDLRSGLLYAQNSERQLLIFNGMGEKLKELNLDPGKDLSSPRQFLVHPHGRKLVVMSDPSAGSIACKLWYVELPTGRTWIDSSGAFSVEADLIEIKDGKVILKATDGRRLSIPVDKLSKADQQHLESSTDKNRAKP
jgi:S1-C subfamily serine protease